MPSPSVSAGTVPDASAADADCACPPRDIAPIYRAGLGRRVPKGYLRIGASISIRDLLNGLGLDVAGLCRAAGVSPELFDHPDNTVPMVRLGRLAVLCERATGRADFGLMVAESATASNLGLVGFLLKQAPDVRTALSDITHYLHYTDQAAVPSFSQKGNLVTVGYSVLESNVPGLELIYDGAIGIYFNVLKGLCGPHWQAAQVTIARRRPPSPARYERFFGTPVLYDAEATTISFDAKWLEMPVPNADPALRRLLQEHLDLMEAEEQGDLAERVRRMLRTVLLTRTATIDDIAGLLHLTRRTLTRRLDSEGTSFRILSDEIQFEIARQLLEHTAMSMTQIALALHYSETSAFSRAFRQWSGMPPRNWRSQHLRSAVAAQ